MKPGPRVASNGRGAEAAERLTVIGIGGCIGPNDLAVIVGRSRREIDRLRASGRLPPRRLQAGEESAVEAGDNPGVARKTTEGEREPTLPGLTG